MDREPLSRAKVVEAGVALADAEGLDAVSMRRLGQELGVEAMSLYNHVANKEDLLTGMLEEVVAEFTPTPTDTPWREALTISMTSAYRALLDHPWAPGLMMQVTYVGPVRLGFMDAALACLVESGFDDVMVHHGFHALDALITSASQRALAYDVSAEDEAVEGQAFIDALPDGAFPHLVDHIRWHTIDHEGLYSEFEFGLKLVLDALDRA